MRDDDSGELWSPTAQPIRCAESTYVARHGAGYSRFEHFHDGIQLDLVQFVPPDEPVKVSVLTVENRSGRPRRLSLTAYAEWVLGTSRGANAPWIVTECEPETKALLATNPWNAEFGGRVAFLDMCGRQTAWTADRTEFLGRNGGPERPAGLARGHQLQQSGRGRAWIRVPCCRRASSWPPGSAPRSSSTLGQADTREAAIDLIRRARGADHAATLGEIERCVGRRPSHHPGADTGPLAGHHAERLARLPDPRLPAVGASGPLPGRRRVRIPRPAPGRDRADRAAARARPRAPAPRGSTSVRRGRRAALVASPVRSRRPHAHLRRPVVAAVRRRPLSRRHRRSRRPRRDDPVPRGPAAARPSSTTPTSSRSSRRGAERCSNIARRRSTAASASVPTACP